MIIRHGMNRADLDRLLISLGGNVEYLRRTGEVACSHPCMPSRPRANGRRKDAPRHLTGFVRKVAAMATMLAVSSVASAGICDHAKAAERAVKAAAATAGTQLLTAAAPWSAVMHSSGQMILTGSSGYVAHSLGFVGAAWAAVTSPVTLTVAGGVLAAGAGVVAVCHYGPAVR